jgi:branched-chain amino acid transport system ATP-binding protein
MRDVLDMFPALQGRLHVAAGLLSGGEQQMLTLGRALLGNPKLMLIDEPAEGLAPQIIVQVANCLQTLRARGVAVLLIEQKLDLALTISDRCLVMGQGRIVWSGAATGLRDEPAIQQEWLAV